MIPPGPPTPETALTLCIDLDGTLIRADLSVESVLAALKRQPWILFWLPLWLLQGKARLKAELAKRTQLDASVLPYNEAVLALIQDARAAGKQVWLVTGSHRLHAERVQDHLRVFDRILATDDDVNLTGSRKAAALDQELGAGRYTYVANGAVDMPIWQSAGEAITVDAPASVVARVKSLGKPHHNIEIDRGKSAARRWLKAIRIHQWAKNTLLFVPLITAHQLLNLDAITAAVAAFFAMGLCASATYIINDLLDLDADRHHTKKRTRPFAAGMLSVQSGIIACIVMLTAGILIALQLPTGFQIALACYLFATLLYSFRLKRVASLDVLLLAGLYTLRVVAGAWATGLALSFWLLAFSMFIFLCLALVKRVAELVEMRRREADTGAALSRIKGREYGTEDIPILQVMGATSGYLSVLVLALYIHSPEVARLYATPEILWLIAPLMLLWVTRLWVVTTRGYMNDDPIFFAIKDPETWITAAITGCILIAATKISL
jgi:4-hydroxybenzoate polyprenyltransferase/phosphoserine phosphatase